MTLQKNELMRLDKVGKPCLISCGILKEEIEKLVDEGSLDVDLFCRS